MTADDIARVRDAFVAAARRAVRIGFDAIELHMAHGYLVHSFLSPLSNRRADGYGGSPENRMRFACELALAVREAVPRTIALGARITGSDWLDGGLTPADAVAFATALKQTGIDSQAPSRPMPAIRSPPATMSRSPRSCAATQPS
jgi:2,4-dienoyl-CoA reductase-like NADH-dependent reductase (Old Yellow Enzyme family)